MRKTVACVYESKKLNAESTQPNLNETNTQIEDNGEESWKKKLEKIEFVYGNYNNNKSKKNISY